uniref:Paired domain-containing protein n=1 Tax=Wuchereria bancrofti TaxID=6293 RepID=A0A1I8EJC6_WUCBA
MPVSYISMALTQNMIASSTALDHEIQIYNTQIDYISLLLTTGHDNASCFTPALSCTVPIEAQQYILPHPLSSNSCIINPSKHCESMKKEKQPKNPCKLIASNTPLAISSKNKLGRPYNPGRPLAMEERQKILQLYEKGHRISHIARIIGVTHSCVSKIMTRYRRTGSMQPRSTFSTTKKNIDCSNDMNADSVPNNNYQEVCRSCSAGVTLNGASRPVKSYLIQRSPFISPTVYMRSNNGVMQSFITPIFISCFAKII